MLSISGCGQTTTTVDIPDGQTGATGCATTLSKTKTGKVTTITAKDCNNQTLWSETVSDGDDGTNCVPTFSSAHDATNKKTVVTISGCGSTSTVDIPDGQDGTNGTNGTNGVGVCDNVADPATANKNTVSIYTAGNATTIGYTTNSVTKCNGNTSSSVIEDACTQIVDERTSGKCTGAYLLCTNAQTQATYNVCKAITGTNVTSIASAIGAAQSAAETYTDNAVANKVTSSDVNSAISTALSDYDTSTQVSNKITAATSDKVTNSALNTTLGSYLQTANLGTALKDTALKDDVASAVSASGALSGYLTSANAAETYATQSSVAGKQDALTTTQLAAVNSGITSNKITTYDGYATTIANKADASALNTANGKITALETTVGDSSSGLVAQVNTNTNAIGDSTSGLTKAVADATSTANTASTNATQAKQDAASALSGLDAKLDKTTASSTYLSKTDAQSTYLTKTSASSTYATKSALSTVETTANNAASDASTAKTNAATALSTANTASSNATSALNTANGHTSQISTLEMTVGVGSGANSVNSLVARMNSLQSSYATLQSNYNTLSQNYTTLQNRVAAMEACSNCAAPKADN